MITGRYSQGVITAQSLTMGRDWWPGARSTVTGEEVGFEELGGAPTHNTRSGLPPSPTRRCRASRLLDELGAAPDDAVPLLIGAGQEAGDVDERQHRHVERVTEAQRLVGDDTHGRPSTRPTLASAEPKTLRHRLLHV